ncbi:ester cyclase [Actinoplanes sp. URMC 104]|uniref:ester cyclase n=1 Tax=Actinoplanes sp. URMC 104 TaxID=3423409 RepID=UPI003F1DE628
MPSAQDDHKQTYRRFHDAVNSRDLQVISRTIDRCFHPDALFHAGEQSGADAVQAQKRIWPILLRAFPDLHVTIDDLLADGDKVVARQTVTGTNTGEYRGLPATGRPVVYREIFIARIAGDRIAELWGVVDVYGQLRQLGLIPE